MHTCRAARRRPGPRRSVVDPIEAFYSLEAAVRAAARPALRERMAAVRARVSPRLSAQEWAALYREAAAIAAELSGLAGPESSPSVSVDDATRRFVDAALRDALGAPHAVNEEWSARLQRQRDAELLAKAKAEVEMLEFDLERTGARLTVRLPAAQATRWCDWLSSWLGVWANKVTERVPATLAEKVEVALEPAWARLPKGLVAQMQPSANIAPYVVPPFALGLLEETTKLPTTFELFFQSFRNAMFAIMGIAAVLASGAAALLGEKTHLRALGPLLVLPLGVLVYRHARARAHEHQAEREAALRKVLAAKILQSTKDHLDVVHAGLRAWIQRHSQASREAIQRYANETAFRLDAVSDGRKAAHAQSDASRPNAGELVAALRSRAAALDGGS